MTSIYSVEISDDTENKLMDICSEETNLSFHEIYVNEFNDWCKQYGVKIRYKKHQPYTTLKVYLEAEKEELITAFLLRYL